MTTTTHAHASSAQHPRAALATAASAPLRPATQAGATAAAMATTPLDDDAATMLDILDMDLDMSIPDVVATATSAVSAATPLGLPAAATAVDDDALVAAVPQQQHSSHVGDHEAQSAAAMKSQTCVTFLHIMKEFSESSCNATEMVERVDSLVHQDEQLLKLLPLTKADDASDARRRDARQLSDDALDLDAPDSRLASPRSVDLERSTSALLLRKLSADLLDCSDSSSSSRKTRALDAATDDHDAATDDHDARAAKRRRENDREMDAHDELQRWIDLDLELDHRMDVFDFTQDTVESVSGPAAAPGSVSRAALPVTPSLGRPATSPFVSSAKAPSGALRGHASAVSRDLALQRNAAWSPGLGKKSVTAALFGDDDDDDDSTDSSSSSAASAVIDTMARAKLLASASSSAAARSAAIAAASAAETKCDDENVWGVEDDEYQQDLLSSIDHSVLCDRENRFLQWDLEMEAQQQQQQHLTTPPPSSSFSSSSPSRPSASSAGVSGLSSAPMPGDRSKHKWLLASSPREKIAKSPSNVDIVDDWSSLDFGTFQNRTVSHILSSCLHKRKLYHPYKHQVKLVNFNVSGSAAIADPVEPAPHRGSLATSLAFGGSHDDDVLRSSGTAIGASGATSVPGATTQSSASATAPYGLKDAGSGLDKAGLLLKGEKKSKKREERKRLMSLKMQETFADLEGTFTEQDLDFKNVAGAGSLSKMALAKLEALPLPDLSNLPQDLKELKRKIEATEHKVEGTKHRHRKGGPCPRCQVQNQLRAAKRAYHKRAVAHKKLPQTSALSGSTASPAVGGSVLETEASDLLFRSPPLTPTPAAFDGTSPSLSPASTASPATSAMRAASAAPFLPVVLPASVLSTAAPAAKPSASLLVSVGATSATAASSALLQHRQQTAAAQLVKNANRSLVAAAAGMAPHASGRPAATGFQTSAPRRPCGNTFAASTTSSAGASAASSSSATAVSPPSPEPASPHVHHVTVTSA